MKYCQRSKLIKSKVYLVLFAVLHLNLNAFYVGISPVRVNQKCVVRNIDRSCRVGFKKLKNTDTILKTDSTLKQKSGPEKQSFFSGNFEDSVDFQNFAMKSSVPKDIINYLFRNEKKCNHVNVCTALYKISKISKKKPLSLSEKVLLQDLIDTIRSLNSVRRFSARHLSNIAVALATLDYSDLSLISDLCISFIEKIDKAKPSEVSMFVWGCATLNYYDPNAYLKILTVVKKMMHELTTKELCTMCWALTSVNHFDHLLMIDAANLFCKRSKQAVEMNSVLAPHDVSMMVWVFSQNCVFQWALQNTAVMLMETAVEPQVFKSASLYKPTDLTQLVVAMSKLSYDNTSMMEKIAEVATAQLNDFSAKEISALLFSMAKLNYKNPIFLAHLMRWIKVHLTKNNFSGREISNMLWAMAVLQIEDVALLIAMFNCLQAPTLENELELRQVHQSWLVFNQSYPEIFKNVDRNLISKAAAVWRAEKRRQKISSSRHIELSKCLSLMKIEHRNESEHDIDIEVVGTGLRYIQSDGSSENNSVAKNPNFKRRHVQLKLALEIDGPGHYTYNTLKPLGHTVLKHRILELMGWKVVQIPYYEWDKIPFWASMERKRYLQRKLGITRTLYFGERDRSTFKPFVANRKETRFD